MRRRVDRRSEQATPARWIGASTRSPGLTGALLAVAAVTEAIGRSIVDDETTQFTVVLCLLALATTLPVALLTPVSAAIAGSAATVLSLTLFDTLTVAGFAAVLILLHRLGGSGSPLIATALAAPFVVMALVGDQPTASAAGVLTPLLASIAPAAAWAGFARRASDEAHEHREARRAIAGELLDHTARGERARIARELHDVVAHHISMVAVQAETARLTTDGMPAAGAQRLTAIGDTARAALTEMRSLLGVLREDVRAGDGDIATRHPQPGLDQLNELIDAVREASGTCTRLILSGQPIALDPGVELAAYRIAQEALTNARRHAPGAAVDVELQFRCDSLLVRVRDNGPGPGPLAAVGGHGLTGMRERAAAVGGDLRVGPAAGGGFLVEVTLPVPLEARA